MSGVHRKYDVVVFGAGYAGLTAAIELLRKGKRVLLVEQEPGISPKSYYGGVGDEGLVYLSSEWIPYLEASGLSPLRRDEKGAWMYGMAVIAGLVSRFYELGGVLVLDSMIEPIFVFDNEKGFKLTGAEIKEFGGDLSDTRFVAEADVFIDTTFQANLANTVIDRLKLEVPVNGYGPIVPGSREVVDRTGWLIPGVLLAGLSVSMVVGSPRPFPDIGPLLGSGALAAEIVLKGRNAYDNSLKIYPGII